MDKLDKILTVLASPSNDLVILTVVAGFVILIIFMKFSSGTPKKKGSTDMSKDYRRQTSMKELPQFQTQTPYKRGNERRNSVAGESMNDEEMEESNQSKKVVHEKSDEARKRIAEITVNNLLIRNLDRHQKEEIFDAMLEKKVKAGENIITQGDEGDYFYVTDSGHFDILVNNVKVAESKAGGSFGELALLYGQPRAATVKATEDSVVWSVDRATFRRIVLMSNFQKRKKHQKFLKEVALLSNLNDEELMKATDSLEPVSFAPGELIINEGEVGDTFYIIEEGSVVVKVKGEIVGKKQKGEYFGEIALLTDGFRVASVEAETDVDCLVLDKNAFVRLLGPCVEILKRNMETYKQYEEHVE